MAIAADIVGDRECGLDLSGHHTNSILSDLHISLITEIGGTSSLAPTLAHLGIDALVIIHTSTDLLLLHQKTPLLDDVQFSLTEQALVTAAVCV